MKQQSKPKIKINPEEWTPERFKAELIDEKTGRNRAFTEENKAALYSLTRAEAIQLDPRIFARWKFAHDNHEITTKSGKESARRRAEVKDWSVKVRQLLGDPEIAQLMLNQKKLPKWLNVIDNPTAADVIVATLMAKAMTGNVAAVEELRKLGFGDKVVIDAGESFFNKNSLKLEIVQPDAETQAAKAEETIMEDQAVAELLGEEIDAPAEVVEEFVEQEAEINMPAPKVAPIDQKIDPSIIKGMVITKNKRNQ